MNISLGQIISWVGKLDDSPGDETARERFRRFIKENLRETGQVRDYIQEALRTTGDPYNKALQDLANYVGELLGFEVTYGRYHGVPNQIGFDGHWFSSSKDFHIVVEVKTTEVYAIKTDILANYVEQLISGGKIPSWDQALGLYVIGRPDPELKQLETSIIGQRRTHQFRIASIDSLLTLAELMNEYDISHDDVISILRPSGPQIDHVIELMSRLVAQSKMEEAVVEAKEVAEVDAIREDITYWLTPVRSDEEGTAEETIRTLVGKEKLYAFGERTPGRKHIKPEDRICFYESGNGVVAHATVASKPERKPHPQLRHPDLYPWTFKVKNMELYFESPIIITAELRSRLDRFKDRNPQKHWAWFVQATHRVSKNDFEILTGKE